MRLIQMTCLCFHCVVNTSFFFAFFAFFSVIRSNNCSLSHLSAALKACLPEAVYLVGVDFNVDSRCKVILDMLK
jgi:hypothetical protein